MDYSTMPCSATVEELRTDAGTKSIFDLAVEEDYRARRRTVADLAWDLRDTASGSGPQAKIVLDRVYDSFINADEVKSILRAACRGDRQAVGEQIEKLIDQIAARIAEDE